MRLPGLLKNDILFQVRHGFYLLYLLVSALYVFICSLLPERLLDHVLPELLFVEVTLIGYIFIGGIILLEREQKLIECLFITPLRIGEYILSKIISLLLLSLLVGFGITLFAKGVRFNPLMLAAGMVLGSVFFTLIGIALAVLVKRLNGYILISLLVIGVCTVPLLAVMLSLDNKLLYLLPGAGTAFLLHGAISGLAPPDIVFAVASATVFAAAAYLFAYKKLKSHITKRIGSES